MIFAPDVVMLSAPASNRDSTDWASSVTNHIRRTNLTGLIELGLGVAEMPFDDATSTVSSASFPSSSGGLVVEAPVEQVASTGTVGKKLRDLWQDSVSRDISFVDVSKFTVGCKVCQLQFKHVYRDYVVPIKVLADNRVKRGSFLIVESHLNPYLIDMGVLTTLWTTNEYLDHKRVIGESQDEEENYLGLVVRVATLKERAKLPLKLASEIPTLQTAREIVRELHLLMDVYVAEYQFDGRILFLYYTSAGRVDYRELVRQMVEACNNRRVKMKKTNLCRKFVPHRFATVGLETGHLPAKGEPWM